MSCSSPTLISNARTGNRPQLKANNFTYFKVKKKKKRKKKARKSTHNKLTVARFSQNSYGIQQTQGFLKVPKIFTVCTSQKEHA